MGYRPIEEARADFPILSTSIHGQPLVYLDTAASAQKPLLVQQRVQALYASDYSNVHRGLHTLSERATEQYEAARDACQAFLHAAHTHEIIFTSGATAAINLVASTFSEDHLQPGDEVLITAMEHHANIVPWQKACKKKGAHLRVIPLRDNATISLEDVAANLTKRTKLLAVSHASNVLGTINDIKAMTECAHARNVAVLVDGAQAACHIDVDVQDLGCDFYVMSGHKCYGPTGVGVLYGRSEWLERLPPYQLGGEMIDHVTFERSTYAGLPHKFEAGTPNIAGVIGLHAALDYITQFKRATVLAHEAMLARHLYAGLKALPMVKCYGSADAHRVSLVCFSIDGCHPHDVGLLLDRQGIAVRVGHHCAQPLMSLFGVTSTIRASLGLYNNIADVDCFLAALPKIIHRLT